jgi:hypothetical protein
MDVDGLDRVGLKDGTDLTVRTRMDRQTGRDVSSDAMNGDAIDDLSARKDLTRATRGSDDADVVACGSLLKGQRAHLRLNAPGSGQVAVTDVGDPHSGDRTPQWVHHDISTRL